MSISPFGTSQRYGTSTLLLPPCRFPPWPVAALRGRVRHRGHVLAPHRLIGPLPPGLQRLLGWVGRDEGVAAGADQVGAAGLLERLADLEVVLRLEELHQGSLQLS